MNKAVLLTLTGTLALLTVGCSLFSDSNESGRELEENTVKPIPVQAQGSQETEPKEELADLEAEAEPTQEIAGLIPATNPEVRVRSSVRGRQDPFSVVSLNPRIEIEETESDNNPPNPNPNSNRDRNLPSPVATRSRPLPVPPPLEPEPTLAQDVVITGLYQANGVTRLIVQAPEENTSRYVQVGEYLSNGQVLVKSIDTSQSPPLVILEQSGVEVAKIIGEDAEAENGSDISFSPPGNPPNPYRLSSVMPK